MRIEEFDDAIRNKLNSISYTHTEADINKVHNYVGQKTAFINLQVAKILSLSFAGAVVAGLLVWNIVQHKDNSELSKKIQTLEKELTQTQKHIELMDERISEKVVAENKDAENDIDINNRNTQSVINERDEANKSVKDNSSSRWDKNLPDADNDGNYTQNSESNINRNTKNIPGKTESRKTKNGIVSNRSTNKKYTENRSVKDKSADSELQANQTAKKEIEIETEKETEQETEKNNEAQDEIAYIDNEKNDSDTVREDDVQQIESKKTVETENMKMAQQSEEKKPSFSYKPIHYNIGLGARKGAGNIGFGLAGQIFFTDRIGINAGLDYVSFNKKTFAGIREFNEREKRDFRKIFGAIVKDTNGIENIETRLTLVQIPVSFTYVLPLKNSFGLALAAGTDFDMSLTQHINIERRKRGNEHVKMQEFSISIPKRTFNNIMFSAGIQKTWQHFSVQLNPYVNRQFRKMEYRKMPLHTGINLKAFYIF